ncbi:hypothetical protein Tco_0457661 [Tanacetum coccineum]
MGTKVTSSSGSVLEEPEIQKLQMQAKIFKENSLNKLNALKSTTQLLERQSILYQQAFAQLFGDSVRTFKFQLSQHMNNLETLLNAETLHEMDSKSALSVIKVQFERFINSDLLKPLDIYSRSFSSDREVRENFRDYTKMTAQTFKETIIQNMNSIEQCIIERASHEQELKMTLKRLNESQVQIQECTVQKVQSSVTSSGDETSSGIVSEEEIDKKELEAHYGFMAKIQEVLPAESSSTDTPLEQVQNNDENNVFANERQHSEKNSAECTDERAALANLIANLTLDTEENKTILKQLKKANASLTQELKECRTNLDETGRALGEATSCRDSCLIALQNKQNEFEKYKAFNDRTIDYEILQTKLNETLGLLALKDIEIKEGLKTKAYEISVLNQKHDELVKKSLLTKSQLEGYLKENTKVLKAQMQGGKTRNMAISEFEKKLIENARNRITKHVSFQSPKEFVGSNDMVHNYYLEKAKKSAQLQKDKDVNGKPSMIDPARLPQHANVHFYSANHDECVLEYLSRLNHHASAQNKDAKSHRQTKRYMLVEKVISYLYGGNNGVRNSLGPSGLRWVPQESYSNSCKSKVIVTPTHGSNIDIHHFMQRQNKLLGLVQCQEWVSQKNEIFRKLTFLNTSISQPRYQCKNDASYTVQVLAHNDKSVSAKNNTQAPFLNVQMMFEQRSSSLVLHQMTSDHNVQNSEFKTTAMK